MATTVYAVDPLTGVGNSTTLTTGWTGSFSTGGLTKMNADAIGILMQTGIAGGFADYTRLDLSDAATTALTDYGVLFQWYFNNPLTDSSVAIFLRSSNDWTNFNNPATWVRTSLDNVGGVDIKHRLSSGTQVTDASGASGTVALIAGVSNWCRFEAEGTALRAKWWNNNSVEPSGWTLTGTMGTDIVSAAGRIKIRLLGSSAAGVTNYARIRNFTVYTLDTVVTPPAAPFVATPGRLSILRGRRRR